jgi:LPS sulfotransferase NodH
MLEVEESGYEGKFDFPRRDRRPDMAYMLATIPRTGSTYLSHLLWRTGCLGAPLEYLNFDKEGPYFFAHKSQEEQLWLWRSVLRRRTSPNGVFGFKCFLMQLQALRESNPTLLSEVRPKRVVYLGRRDRIAHSVSYARASMSGVWRAEQEKGGMPELRYSQEALEMAENGLEAQAAGWDEMFRGLGIEPLRLWYEDVVADPVGAARQVADYVGVPLLPNAEVRVPAILKQSASETASWAARYAESKGAAQGLG